MLRYIITCTVFWVLLSDSEHFTGTDKVCIQLVFFLLLKKPSDVTIHSNRLVSSRLFEWIVIKILGLSWDITATVAIKTFWICLLNLCSMLFKLPSSNSDRFNIHVWISVLRYILMYFKILAITYTCVACMNLLLYIYMHELKRQWPRLTLYLSKTHVTFKYRLLNARLS